VSHPTIRDVAKKAGVGIGTVSRVINGSDQVKSSTRERVLTAIKSLGYKPNQIARQLPRKTRLRNIGVITQPFLSYPSFVERLRGAQMALSEHTNHYEIILYNVSSLESYAERLKTIAQSGAVDGVLVIDLELNAAARDLLTQAHLPFTGLNNHDIHGETWRSIGTDDTHGAYLATQYLLDLGHRRIAYVGDHFQDAYNFSTSASRFAGYEKALAAHGLKPNSEHTCKNIYGYDYAKADTALLLKTTPQPTAIFAMSDVQALGCIAAIREAGLRVPEDISVIGYDDLELSYHSGLSTIRQHLDDTGRVAMEYLLHMIEGGAPHPVPELPPLQVIPRQTTRRLPGSELSSASS